MKPINLIQRLAHRALPRRFRATLQGTAAKAFEPLESSQNRALRDFVQPHFDTGWYLERNSDVRRAGIDPLMHWLRHGIWEGRGGPSTLELVTDLELDEDYGWRHFKLGKRLLSVRIKPDRSSIMQQIIEQARFEPTVLATGALAIGNLRTYRGDDLLARDGVNIAALYEGMPDRIGVLVATPMLVAGGAEKYIADMVNELAAQGRGPVVVLVTDQTRQEAQGWEQLKVLAPLQAHSVRFWSDAVGASHGTADHFARFAQSLRPSMLVANNSRIALDAIVRFGRGLSQNTRLFCTYFSLSPLGLGAPFGARYPTWTCAHATSVTDNEVMHTTLVEMTKAIPGTRVAIVPPLAPVLLGDEFEKRLASRRLRYGKASQRRWAWVSRVEPAKGTEILRLIALKRPGDKFDVYGPVERSACEGTDLRAPNVQLRGLITDVASADFTMYDGFLFTSLFEGMPNVVLEMAQHAIPLVLADVGGISNTFVDGAALLVQHEKNSQATADRFDMALERLVAMPMNDVERMVRHAYDRVEARHGAAAHSSALHDLLG